MKENDCDHDFSINNRRMQLFLPRFSLSTYLQPGNLRVCALPLQSPFLPITRHMCNPVFMRLKFRSGHRESWLDSLPTNNLKLNKSSFHPRDFSTGKPPQESNQSFQLVVRYPRLWKERQFWTLFSKSANYYRQHWCTTCRPHPGTLSLMQLGFQHGILEKHVYSEFSFGPRVHWIKAEVAPIVAPQS